jgi:signal transduction histidine kinase
MQRGAEQRAEQPEARSRLGFAAALRGSDFLAAHAAAGAALGFFTTLLWAITDRTVEFWPRWVWFSVVVLVSLHFVLWRSARQAQEYMDDPQTPSSTLEVVLIYKIPLMIWSAAVIGLIWLMTGAGYLWPRWPWFGILFTVCAEIGLRELLRRRREADRERKLAERVGELQRTRRGALEEQAAQLRRVERDLHDGAQSRLVTLSMTLGRAEERLADQPEVAELVRAAREEAGAAIAELRDLARGIAPPVLADRGLEAAVRSLAARSAGPVEVEVDVAERPVPVLETTAYFVVAEALTNAAKHAPDARVHVAVSADDDFLRVRVADNGPGGANPQGSGLTGLRHRVEALDGTLRVSSPPGIGTTIEMELPCAS